MGKAYLKKRPEISHIPGTLPVNLNQKRKIDLKSIDFDSFTNNRHRKENQATAQLSAL